MCSDLCKSGGIKNTVICKLLALSIAVILQLHVASSSLLLPKKWEVTQTKSDELQYAWTINDLHYEESGSEVCIKSLEFSSMTEDHQKWMLMACASALDTKPDPTSDNKVTAKLQRISVSLFYLSGHPESIQSQGRLTVLNGAYEEIHTFFGVMDFERYANEVPPRNSGRGYLHREVTANSNLKNATPVNELVVHVTMKIHYDSTRNFSSNECSVTSPTTRKNIESKYKNEYLRYKNSPLVSVMTRDNRPADLNTEVLRQHSPVSEQRFRDFDYDEVKEIINFLYTGGIPHTPYMRRRLFLIAKEFELDEMKELAEEQLCNSISLNMSEMVDDLIFAYENDANTVKSRIVSYIATQSMNLLSTPVFSKIKESKEDLFREILDTKEILSSENIVEIF